MEGDEQHRVVLACTVCGVFFCVLSPLSFWILWAVNWRPWRIYSTSTIMLDLLNCRTHQ
ncbi:hypothetical protein B296_00026857 [Ensete ventricosum]|uniref:Uncharacterized protein n=1 Tax=Ensete ventricosum TaxID=4639 RepID=A0A426Z483_ENSVE|nr:hypothetical protein B296_00026857 [Ensete ventricosum]